MRRFETFPGQFNKSRQNKVFVKNSLPDFLDYRPMFSLLQRILRSALRHPKAVLAFSFCLTVLSVYPVTHLKWELHTIDMLPDSSEVKRTSAIVEENFGGFGSLVVVIASEDSARNDRLVSGLAKALEGSRFINFVDYKSDAEFFEKNSLLYIHTSDLRRIRNRLSDLRSRYKLETNPLYVNLLSDDSILKVTRDSIAREISDSLSIAELERKYLSPLKTMYSNENGTIRALNIFPKKKVSDLDASRKLIHVVNGAFESLPESDQAKMFMTGKVFQTASEGRLVLSEARSTGIILAAILALFLLFRFARRPALFLLSIIPMALVLVWTMAAAWMLYGRINLYSLVLAIILPGISSREIIHLMTRYADEQRKGLGYELSLESALLGIGPTIAVSAFSIAGAFLGLLFVPLAGMQELGVLGGIGSILNWAVSGLVFPALIEVTGHYRTFLVFDKIKARLSDFKERPFAGFRKYIVLVLLLSLVLPIRGVYPEFDYDFSHTEYNPKTFEADELLSHTNFLKYDPVVVVLPSAEKVRAFYNRMNREIETNPDTKIRAVAIYQNLLPSNQQEKISLIREIRGELDPEILKRLSPADSDRIEGIVREWNDVPVLYKDLPENLRRIFGENSGGFGEFAFLLPNFDPDDGLACRKLAKELEPVKYPKTGTALVRAELLNRTLPHFHKAILFGIASIFFLTFLFYRKISFSLFTLASPIIAFFWLLSLLRLLGIELSSYSSLAFPILIGMSIEGSVQLWSAYYERSTGSIYYILKTTGLTCLFSEFLTVTVLFGLFLSSHPGVREIGLVSVLGILCITLSHLFVFPLLAGWLDVRRIRRRKIK